jgi:uncharacterized protein YyaL (SSP411 family)
MVKTLRKVFAPSKVVLFRRADEATADITHLAEFTKDLSSLNDKTTAYVCRNFLCELPTTEAHRMLALLQETA